MSDGISQIEYLALLSGMTVDQVEESVRAACEALRDGAYCSAEFTTGLTSDDRRWVHDLDNAAFQPPAQFAEQWLARAEGIAG